MNTNRTYRNFSALALTVFVSVFLLSCIREYIDECRTYLEFIYDHNMEYTDSFDPHVGSVDLFIFDAQDKYLFTMQSSQEELIGNKRMPFGYNLPFGKYKILTVGGLSDNFRVTGKNGSRLIPGETTPYETQIALARNSNTVSHEFPSLWIGTTKEIDYQANETVHPIHLIKATNLFNLVLASSDYGQETKADTNAAAYTFEIITPEGAVYGHDNSPINKETVKYTPYSLTAGDAASGAIAEAHINTGRLLHEEEYDYRLTVCSTETGKVVWDYDLMNLLEHTKPASRPDGSPLPMQEYLDRQSEWHIVVIYKGDEPGGPENFVAVKVIVNDWIIWLNDIGI